MMEKSKQEEFEAAGHITVRDGDESMLLPSPLIRAVQAPSLGMVLPTAKGFFPHQLTKSQ